MAKGREGKDRERKGREWKRVRGGSKRRGEKEEA